MKNRKGSFAIKLKYLKPKIWHC